MLQASDCCVDSHLFMNLSSSNRWWFIQFNCISCPVRMTKPFKQQQDIIPSTFFTSTQPDTRQASSSSSQHEDDRDDGDGLPISCFMKTCIDGSNFSQNQQCEYRIKIHPAQMTCVTEQSVHHLLTNIQISNMNNFCMFLQINSEDRIHKEFKLYTQGFIYPSYSGKLYVKVKNLSTFTKVLHPCDIVGYLVIQPFILREDNHHQQHTCTRSML